jgi:2-iminoacetate synthase
VSIRGTARNVYDTRVGHGEIRRVNINAAPLDVDGYRVVKEAGIGTYQVFQETYHHETFARVHRAGTQKADYLWRLDALSRAFEAGQDDVGIGALFGLADWKFETLALVAHSLHLQTTYGCGPHTVSFPRLTPASGLDMSQFNLVNDHDFKRLIAILRLAVPYTGLILTAREKAELRREVLEFGVSQIDAGTRIEMGGYTACGDAQSLRREQFTIGDIRSLDEVVAELLATGYVPSWCTACYRLGRTGEHFMEFAIPGFIKRYCTPNALTTLKEYLVDYASPETRALGEKVIQTELDQLPDGQQKQNLVARLTEIDGSEKRDLYF